MDQFLNFKRVKALKTKAIQEDTIRTGAHIKIIRGTRKGIIGTIRSIKEDKWIYVITCMNELSQVKIKIEDVILLSKSEL